MSNSIREFVEHLPIVDVHEHHLPEIIHQREVNLLQLFQQSYAGWAQARPYCLPSESRDADPMLSAAGPTTWEALAPFLDHSGSNFFVRNMVRAVVELHGGGGVPEITRDNWQALDAAVRAAHRRPEWQHEVLNRARITTVITDAYNDPLLDPRPTLGANYRSVMRTNSLALGWHPDSHDHNDNRAHELLKRVGLKAESFEEYLVALEKLVAGLAARGQVALKNSLAYDRDINFDEPNEPLARAAWGKAAPSPAERKAFGDFIVDYLCRIAAARDIPVQLHLGTGIIRGSHPLGVAGLIERHPRARFLLMHLAYPWSRDLLGMAFVYRNIWLDLTWSFLLSPSHFKLALHEAIEVLPNESRMMLGGDNWHVEETYGGMQTARRLIAEVLDEKLASGYFSRANAERLARRIFHDNAREFFRLA
jgi:uncharacterized protein